MATGEKFSTGEKAGSIYRDFNAMGSVALFGAGVIIPPLAPVMNVMAGINLMQAGAGEWFRRRARKRRLKSQK